VETVVKLGELVPIAFLLERPSTPCTCEPALFPDVLDADCPHHGLRALVEGRFDVDDPVQT
jgi:hypothetical protein